MNIQRETEREVDAAKTAIDNIFSNFSDLLEENEKLTKEIDAKDSEIESLKEEIADLKAQLADANDRVNELEG